MSILDLQVVKSNEDIGTPFTGTGIATPARKCKPGIVTGSGPERNRNQSLEYRGKSAFSDLHFEVQFLRLTFICGCHR